MRRDLALAEFRLLTLEQQRLCRAAIPQFVQMQQRLGRKHPPNLHLWIRNRGFDEFPTATLEQPAGGQRSYDAAASVNWSTRWLRSASPSRAGFWWARHKASA